MLAFDTRASTNAGLGPPIATHSLLATGRSPHEASWNPVRCLPRTWRRTDWSQNVRLVIIPGPLAIQRVFEITGLTEQLPFIDTRSTGSRTARSRTPSDLAAGSGGLSLPADGAGRHANAAGAAPGTRAAPTKAEANPPLP